MHEAEAGTTTLDDIPSWEDIEVLETAHADSQEQMDGMDDIPLDLIPPILQVADPSDKTALVTEQREDLTLQKIRDFANSTEKGYFWENDLLLHILEMDDGRIFKRVVVPKGRREGILKIAHSTPTAGHYSHNRTEKALRSVLLAWGGSRRTPVLCRMPSVPTLWEEEAAPCTSTPAPSHLNSLHEGGIRYCGTTSKITRWV